MPDRCTPEYERVVAGLGTALPYRRALALLAEVFPLGEANEALSRLREGRVRGAAVLIPNTRT